MRINTNTAAMNTYSRLTQANGARGNSMAKLSSGLRINKAGDDAAGLSISEKMKNQISGLKQATRNAQDGISLIQTAEGALNETHSILNRMRDLTVQASNDTNTTDDRAAIQEEIVSLRDEITRIADTTTFNTKGLMNAGEESAPAAATTAAKINKADQDKLVAAYNNHFAGSTENTGDTPEAREALVVELAAMDDSTLNAVLTQFNQNTPDAALSISDFKGNPGHKTFSFQIGANTGEFIDVELGNMSATGLGLDSINVNPNEDTIVRIDDPATLDTNEDTFGAMIDTIDNAIKEVSTQRATLGATQNRLEHTVSNLTTTSENLSEANSRIRDVDMAEEMMEFTKNNILSQASTAMLAQANQMPQGVLQLLG